MHVLDSKGVNVVLNWISSSVSEGDIVIPLKDLHLFCSLVFFDVHAKSSRWHSPEPEKNQQIYEDYMNSSKEDGIWDVYKDKV